MATLEDAKQWMCDNYGDYKARHLCAHSVHVYNWNDEPWYDDLGEDVEAPFIYRNDFALFFKPFDWRKYRDIDNELGWRYFSDPDIQGPSVPVLSEEPRKFVKHTMKLTEELKHFVLKEPMPTWREDWVPGEENFVEVVYPLRGYVFTRSLAPLHQLDRKMARLRKERETSTTLELASQLLLRQAFQESGASDEVFLVILAFVGSSVEKLENKRVCTKCFRVQTFSCPLQEAVEKEREILEQLAGYENVQVEQPRKGKRKKQKRSKRGKLKAKLTAELKKYQSVLCPYSTTGHTFQLYAESRI